MDIEHTDEYPDVASLYGSRIRDLVEGKNYGDEYEYTDVIRDEDCVCDKTK